MYLKYEIYFKIISNKLFCGSVTVSPLTPNNRTLYLDYRTTTKHLITHDMDAILIDLDAVLYIGNDTIDTANRQRPIPLYTKKQH